MNRIKFVWNGIKVNGKLHRVFYSDAELIGNYPKGTLTIYARDYKSLPQIPGINVKNDSDMMTDYFENDRARISPDNPHYAEIYIAMLARKEHDAKRWAKRA
ncbi:MAG: hypothetical protein ABIA77_01995 [Candidatus Omnitrophota bacterium]